MASIVSRKVSHRIGAVSPAHRSLAGNGGPGTGFAANIEMAPWPAARPPAEMESLAVVLAGFLGVAVFLTGVVFLWAALP